MCGNKCYPKLASPSPPHCTPHALQSYLALAKGGAIAFSPRSQDQTARDATVHLRNSTFQNNTAKTDYGGVVYLMEFATLVVQGDGNVFMENTCESNGAVFAVTDGAELTIEGGNFSSNTAKVRVPVCPAPTPTSGYIVAVNACVFYWPDLGLPWSVAFSRMIRLFAHRALQ